MNTDTDWEIVKAAQSEWDWHPAFELTGFIISGFREVDAEFIAHFGPDKVAELLTRIEVLASQRDTVSNVANSALAAEHNRRISRTRPGWGRDRNG